MKFRAFAMDLGFYSAAALLVAGLTHFATILLIPVVATRDAFSRLSDLAPPGVTFPLPAAGPDQRLFPLSDAATAMAFCRFDLRAGPVRIRAPIGRAGFASLSFHTRRGAVVYALTDRAATHGRMEAVIATASQLRALVAADDEDNPSEDLRILSPSEQGFALSRVFSELPGLYAEAADQAAKLSCTPEPPSK